MKRFECMGWIAFGWLVGAAMPAAAAITGTAYAAGSDQVLYREHYDFDTAPGQWRVEYRLPDGAVLATKRLDFSPGKARPNYLLHYHDSDRTTGAQWQGDDSLLLFNDGEEAIKEVPRATVVIDAGFDHFVRDHWEQLARQSLEFKFAFANDLRLLPLRISQVPGSQTPLENQPGITFFRIEGTNLLLRWFADPIYLGYNDQRELCIYQGISNLRVLGETPKVRIVYREKDTAAPLC